MTNFSKQKNMQITNTGSHVVMVKTGVRINLSIPQHKELSVGTLGACVVMRV